MAIIDSGADVALSLLSLADHGEGELLKPKDEDAEAVTAKALEGGSDSECNQSG